MPATMTPSVATVSSVTGTMPTTTSLKITQRSVIRSSMGTGGPISKEWEVQGWPTLYLIDHKGTVRRKFLGNPGDEHLDRLIDELVAEAEKDKKS